MATFQKLGSFLHYRQDCLFKPRPVFPIGNLEKWKVDSQLVREHATEISHREAIGIMRGKTSDRVHGLWRTEKDYLYPSLPFHQ